MAKGPVIKVQRAPKSSYQGHRELAKNCLLHNQVKHFLEVEKRLPAEHRSGMRPEEIDTEAKAGEFIRRMTEKIHELGRKR